MEAATYRKRRASVASESGQPNDAPPTVLATSVAEACSSQQQGIGVGKQRAGRRGNSRRATTSALPRAAAGASPKPHGASRGASRQAPRPSTVPAPAAPAQAVPASSALPNALSASAGFAGTQAATDAAAPAPSVQHADRSPPTPGDSPEGPAPAPRAVTPVLQDRDRQAEQPPSRGSSAAPMVHYNHLKQMARRMQEHVRAASAARRLNKCEGELTEFLRAIRCVAACVTGAQSPSRVCASVERAEFDPCAWV